jgi:3-oxoacyl-(acyl-carrier-protein) synthase III
MVPNDAPIITGRGMFVPEDVLTNRDVATLADPGRLAGWVRDSKWCQNRREELSGSGASDGLGEEEIHRRLFHDYVDDRIGIRSRHVVDRRAILERRPSAGGVFGAHLGMRAAAAALAEAGVGADDLDVVICGTSTPDRIYPATAVEIQQGIGAHGAYAYDLLAACSSFVYGLEMARGLLLAGLCRRALVVAAEYFSCGVDYADPHNSFFWGDAAAAAVVEAAALGRGKGGYEILDGQCRSHFSENIRTGLGGTRAFLAASLNGNGAPADHEPGGSAYRYFYQNGPMVYRDVIPLAARATTALLGKHGLGVDDVRQFMFHQASVLVIDGIKKRLFHGAPADDRVPLNLVRYGNTSSCGVAICLAEESAMQPGEIACMTAFGAGYTVGAALLRKVAPAEAGREA